MSRSLSSPEWVKTHQGIQRPGVPPVEAVNDPAHCNASPPSMSETEWVDRPQHQISQPPPDPLTSQRPSHLTHDTQSRVGFIYTTVQLRQTTSPPPIRFLCDKCGITFSRQYDRNRHYESAHLVQQCEKCMKQFS